MLLGIDIKMKVVAIFTLCAILAGVAIAKPLPEDSVIVQLVNKVLSRSQSQSQQDAVAQSLLSRLRGIAMLQDILEDKVKEVNKQGFFGVPCVCIRSPCPYSKWG